MDPGLNTILLALIASPVMVEIVRAVQGKRPLVRKLRTKIEDWLDWWTRFRKWARDQGYDLDGAPKPPTDDDK